MILIHSDIKFPDTCSECELCDNYCLIMRKTFDGFNPNEERDPACPLVDVYVDEDRILHAVR